jgi:hypothetical protein
MRKVTIGLLSAAVMLAPAGCLGIVDGPGGGVDHPLWALLLPTDDVDAPEAEATDEVEAELDAWSESEQQYYDAYYRDWYTATYYAHWYTSGTYPGSYCYACDTWYYPARYDDWNYDDPGDDDASGGDDGD